MILDHKNNYVLEKKHDYEGHQIARIKSVIYDDDEKEDILEEFNWNYILDMVRKHGDFILTFNTYDTEKKLCRKKLRYSYIDQERNILLMTCRDITDLYLSEKKTGRYIAGSAGNS